jgi:hypothetical protein
MKRYTRFFLSPRSLRPHLVARTHVFMSRPFDEVAARLGIHHVANLAGCPARLTA